jgi:hypothetical protein
VLYWVDIPHDDVIRREAERSQSDDAVKDSMNGVNDALARLRMLLRLCEQVEHDYRRQKERRDNLHRHGTEIVLPDGTPIWI